MSNIDKNDQSNFEAALFAISLEPHAELSLQAQLLNTLRDIILSRPALAGARLPASRTLAAELSVSRTTVQAVYDQIISEGYLTARRGSGTFVADDLPHLSQPKHRPAPPVQHSQPWKPFQTGLPDQALLPHKQWSRHLERAWRDPVPALLHAADPLGLLPLRVAIADHLSAWRHLDCDPEQVVITSGAWEAFEIIFRGLTGPGQTVATEDPCWPKIHNILTATQTQSQPIQNDADGFDATLIPAGVAAAIVTPSRHYPTGRSLPLPRRMALLDWATRTDGLIIEDDYDSEFRYRGQPLPALAGLDQMQHTVYLGSYSKLIGPAMRLGYAVLPKHLLDRARGYLRRVGSRASLIPQPALAGFMQSGEFAVHLRRMRRIYARRQSHLIAQLMPLSDLLEVQPDPSGMHLCLPLKPRLSTQTTDQEIASIAQTRGLSVGALSGHTTQSSGAQALLLGFAGFDEPVLTEACTRLSTILHELA